MKKMLLLLVFIVVTISQINSQTIYYVMENASGDGSSWNKAAGNIQDMIDKAHAGDEIWIAEGIYYPSEQMDEEDVHSFSFVLKDGVSLYGGFYGNETNIDSRPKSDKDKNGNIEAWEFTYETIFSGNIDGIQDIWTKNIVSSDDWLWNYSGVKDNARTVVSSPKDAINETLVDGFTITAAYGDGIIAREKTIVQNCIAFYNALGAFTSYSGTIRNCYAYNNQSVRGGGIYNSLGTVENCLVENNVAYYSTQTVLNGYGGGIYNSEGTVSNCIVRNNHARTYHSGYAYTTAHARSEGGGIFNVKGTVEKCLVMNNSNYCVSYISGGSYRDAYARGGGIFNEEGIVSNCCVINNKIYAYSYYAIRRSSGGGINSTSNSIVYNTTIVNNDQYPDASAGSNANEYYQSDNSSSYNCITEATNLEKNFIRPTSFIGAEYSNEQKIKQIHESDWTLKAGSSFINSGSTTHLPDWIINGTDLAGNPRILDNKIDFGAYEYTGNYVSIDEIKESAIFCFIDKNGFLHVQDLTSHSLIQIYDLNGRLLKEARTNSESTQLSLPQRGIYIIRIQTENNTSSRKLVW